MIAEMNAGKADAITKRRFDHSFHFILNNAAFPKPVLAIKVPSGLEVVDGNHRMGAFCALQMMPDAKFTQLKLKKAAPNQEAWIGTHSGGEAPLT
jgi:NAD(P)H-hydrate repair Nnr-like enzyme with NAD(P)H-hydrate epimerase domain